MCTTRRCFDWAPDIVKQENLTVTRKNLKYSLFYHFFLLLFVAEKAILMRTIKTLSKPSKQKLKTKGFS